jgi:hypothetical protein
MSTRLLNEWIAGPASALYRYHTARTELKKVRAVTCALTDRHLGNLRAFEDRVALIRSFPTGGCVAEVGVADGRFSAQILQHSGPECLYLVDFWRTGRRAHGYFPGFHKWGAAEEGDYDAVRQSFAEEITAGRVRLLRGCSWEQLALVPDGCLNWVYLDAAHDFDSVVRDLNAVLPKLRPGGIVAGHDWVRWGRFGYRCGVVEAVTSFCVTNDFELIGLTFETGYPPSFAIRSL